MADGDFLARLKVALRGDAGAPLVFLGNFEVEDRWAEGEPGLPRFALRSAVAVVNRMDEFALLLAGTGDHVVLKEEPDPDFLAYLSDLGILLPDLLCVRQQEPDRVVTEDALADPALLARLGELHARGARLLPHGVSVLEERLAAAGGIAIAGSPAAVCKAVNGKIYSRHVADELGLRQPPGWTCENLAEWDAAVRRARALLADGGTVVVKDAFGVSGKGILVVDDERILLSLDRKVRSRAERTGDDRLTLLIETWVGKRADLNYQVTVGGDGAVQFDFVKEAITASGVHKGHRFPADLTAAQRDELRMAGEALGRRLAADGYRGVVGVDALVGADERLFPVIEINARSNMSTYQARLQEAFVPAGRYAMAGQYPLRLGGRLPFKRLRAALDGILVTADSGSGVLVNNFATVNAAAGTGGPTFDGRLYALLVADSPAALAALDRELTVRLTRLAEGTRA
jgi:D-alanine-D-alanine ligase-like ATP-grasp enzyme